MKVIGNEYHIRIGVNGWSQPFTTLHDLSRWLLPTMYNSVKGCEGWWKVRCYPSQEFLNEYHIVSMPPWRVKGKIKAVFSGGKNKVIKRHSIPIKKQCVSLQKNKGWVVNYRQHRCLYNQHCCLHNQHCCLYNHHCWLIFVSLVIGFYFPYLWLLPHISWNIVFEIIWHFSYLILSLH